MTYSNQLIIIAVVYFERIINTGTCVGSALDSCFPRWSLTLPSEQNRKRDSSDQVTFFQSSIVQNCWACENCIPCPNHQLDSVWPFLLTPGIYNIFHLSLSFFIGCFSVNGRDVFSLVENPSRSAAFKNLRHVHPHSDALSELQGVALSTSMCLNALGCSHVGGWLHVFINM